MARYRECAPPAALASGVECLWAVAAEAFEPRYRILPDGCVDIIFSRAFGLRAVGAMTTRQEAVLPAGERVIGVRFRPGMGGVFLGTSPRELTDRFVPLEDLWGTRGRGLRERLENAERTGERLAALVGALPPRGLDRDPVRRAIAALAASGGQADLATLARQAELSPRQFRRRCAEEAGLGPKHLARVLRFRAAVAALDGGRRRGWALLAAECGYFDQAHFIHEFREWAGVTPGEYAGPPQRPRGPNPA